MRLWKIVLFAIIVFATSCSIQQQQPKIQITHVLAVTEQGDTLRLPISMIKPNVYYNIISYPNRYYSNWSYGNYYPSHYNYKPIYVPGKGLGKSSNNNNNNSNKIVPRDNTDGRPSGKTLLKTKN